MQDLYKGFKKVAEDESSATLEHENGHKLNIAKSGLNKKHKKALESLPLHQADGTQEIVDPTKPIDQENQQLEQLNKEMQVAQQNEQPFAPQYSAAPEYETKRQQLGEKAIGPIDYILPNLTLTKPGEENLSGNEILRRRLQEQEANQLSKKEQYAPQVEQGLAAQPEPTQAELQQAQAPSQPEPQPIPPKAPALERPGQALMSEAIKTMKPEEIISSPYTNVMQKINAHNQMYMDSIRKKAQADEEFQQQMRDKKIDPNRVYHDMSTGRKIRTIIGMLLGGMAGGILRTENPLQKMLNEEIERDVNLQKQDKTDAMNLYKMHYERLGDEAMAHQAAANNLRSAALMEMEYAMGKLGPNSQMGRLAIQTAANQLKLQNQTAISGLAALEQRNKILSMIRSGNASDVDPAELVNMVVTDDGAKLKALEEIKDAQNLAANSAKILNAFKKAADDRGFYRSTKSMITREMPESVAVFEQSLDPFFKDIAGQNREATKRATFDRITPGPWDSDADVARKREALINFMRATKAAPISKSYGLDLDKFNKTSWTDPAIEKEQAQIDWAKKHEKSTNPEIQAAVRHVKSKYGVR